ncbi:MAG TPA: hypothetical protein PK950_01020 [Candidatus Paceibacterota bacterium]|nr:hypothetical protein [Candidatus Paceibacterota bacterium]
MAKKIIYATVINIAIVLGTAYSLGHYSEDIRTVWYVTTLVAVFFNLLFKAVRDAIGYLTLFIGGIGTAIGVYNNFPFITSEGLQWYPLLTFLAGIYFCIISFRRLLFDQPEAKEHQVA